MTTMSPARGEIAENAVPVDPNGASGGAGTGARTSVLVFNFPLPPNLANARMHWREKMAARQIYETACESLRLRRTFPPRPETPFARATVSAHFVMWSTSDEDNLMARVKWPLDWIVKAGYLVDDRKKCLSWTGIPTQEINRKAMGLIITLEEIR